MSFDEICKYLVDNGFRRVSVEGAHKQIFISEDRKLSVHVEEKADELTAEDDERIKRRLTELGYLLII